MPWFEVIFVNRKFGLVLHTMTVCRCSAFAFARTVIYTTRSSTMSWINKSPPTHSRKTVIYCFKKKKGRWAPANGKTWTWHADNHIYSHNFCFTDSVFRITELWSDHNFCGNFPWNPFHRLLRLSIPLTRKIYSSHVFRLEAFLSLVSWIFFFSEPRLHFCHRK